MPKKVNNFTLRISDSELQFLKLNSKKTVVFSHQEKLKPGIIVKGKIQEPKPLAELIKKVIQEKRIKEKKLILGIPEETAFVRVVTLPKLLPSEIDNALRWQIKSFLPFSYEEIYLDWKLISQNKKTNILIFALSRETIDKYLNVLDSLGLKPIALETTGLTLLRAFKSKVDQLAGSSAKSKKTKQPSVDKNEDIKSKTMGCLNLVIDVNNPTTVLVTKGINKVQGTVIIETDRVKELPVEARKIIKFYSEKKKKDLIGTIFLTGALVDTALIEKLKKETGCNNVFYFNNQELPVGITPESLLIYFLAIKEVEAPKDPQTINILPPKVYHQYHQQEAKRFINIWSIILIVVLLLITIFFVAFSVWMWFQLKTAEKDSLLVQKETNSAQGEIVLKNQMTLNKITQITNYKVDREKWGLFSSRLEKLKVDGLTFNRFSVDYSVNQGMINGFAKDRPSLLKLKKELEALGFKNVKIPLSTLERINNFNFVISFKV